MSDFSTLKNIFTMAEVLDLETDKLLEIGTINETNDRSVRVVFQFNDHNELTEVYVTE